MIWSIVSKEEMNGCVSSPTFHQYSNALGVDRVKMAVVDEYDSLDFVSPTEDVVLLRTASNAIVRTLERKKIRSTAESIMAYELAKDKRKLSRFLNMKGISVPRQFTIDEIKEGVLYFVKPQQGGENIGITEKSICKNTDQVRSQVGLIRKELGQDAVIENCIVGTECTIAGCMTPNGEWLLGAIEEIGEWRPMQGDSLARITEVAKSVFSALGLRHHARLDIRKNSNGELFVIDVNLIPTLGEESLFPKCYLLSSGISYRDTINAVLNSATTI